MVGFFRTTGCRWLISSWAIWTEHASKPRRRRTSPASSTSGRLRKPGTCVRYARWGGSTMRNVIRPLAVIAAVVVTTAVTPVVDPPDVCLNGVTGLIETVDASWSGSNYNIRSTQVSLTGEQLSSTVLTSNAANDVDPRVVVTPSGDALVVWWRDLSTDALVYRKRSIGTGAWGPERPAGAANESNSRPRIVSFGGK